ncbi:putative DNA primase [Acinetobacter phage BS46]|nr:putative DNA primase [Acinetobacter phage BS46]
MSNVETKRIRHTKYVQFMLEVEELIRNGWSFVPAGSTNFGVQLVANFQRSVKQEVKSDVKPETTANEEVSEKVTPVKTQVKTDTKTTAKKAATKEV